MARTINLSRFNQQMVQLGLNFCIPATVQAMFQYNRVGYNISQEELLCLMIAGEENHQPSFEAVIKHIQPVVQNDFTITIMNPISFQEWSDNIKSEINNERPMAINTRVTTIGVHIRCVIGYDNEKKHFVVYNPGESRLITKEDKGNIIPGRILQIHSFVEYYAYQNALDDFNALDATHHQLLIKVN